MFFILSVNIKPKYLKLYAQNDVKNANGKECPRIGPTMSTHPAMDTLVLGKFIWSDSEDSQGLTDNSLINPMGCSQVQN